MTIERVRTGRILLALAVATLLSLALCGQTTVPVPCPLPGNAYHDNSFGTTDSSWFMFSSRSVAMPDQGMVVMSQAQTVAGKGVRLTRTDALGKVVWDYSYIGTPTAGDELPTALAHTASGDLLVAGMVSSYSNLWDPFLMKVDASGNLLWYKTYNCNRCVHISDVAEGVNGTIAMVGMDYYFWTAGWGGNTIWNVGVDPARNAALALVTDATGNTISGTPYAIDYMGGGRVWEFFTDVEPLSSGGFL
ncbi:MAG TPA: hypothetical protein VHL57_02695, partial [Flavobacteriales bacterium]|nr:hypothetical protein [Flavobacteriales bacterium]